jgi:rod shape-determining protein MreC
VDILYRWRRPLVAVLAIMVLATILSYTSRVRHSVLTLGGVVTTVTAPVADALSRAGTAAGSATATIGQLFTLEQENQRLRSELSLLNSMKLELSELEADNTELRGLLHLETTLGGHWRFQAASIIARNPDSWFDTVTVNRGSAAGIRVGMPVIVPEGVVGRVIAVTPNTADVMLLTDPESGVGAVDVRSQAAGVILGQANPNGEMTFQLFTHRPDVQPGDAVVTSGFSQYYPPGLLLGEIVNVTPTEYGLTETATVLPAVDFNRLDTVLVMLSYPKGASVPPLAVTGGTP